MSNYDVRSQWSLDDNFLPTCPVQSPTTPRPPAWSAPCGFPRARPLSGARPRGRVPRPLRSTPSGRPTENSFPSDRLPRVSSSRVFNPERVLRGVSYETMIANERLNDPRGERRERVTRWERYGRKDFL